LFFAGSKAMKAKLLNVIVAIINILIISHAFADEYKFILKTQINDEFYIKESSIEKSGDGYLVEILNIYGHSDPFNNAWSSTQMIKFDCNNSMQLISDKFYSKKMGQGDIIQSNNIPLPEMPLAEGSAYWVIQNIICDLNYNSTQTSNDEITELTKELFQEIEKNTKAIGEGIEYAISSGQMSNVEAFNFLNKISAKNVSPDSMFILGGICQFGNIEDCANILVMANNWENGVDDFAKVLKIMLEDTSKN